MKKPFFGSKCQNHFQRAKPFAKGDYQRGSPAKRPVNSGRAEGGPGVVGMGPLGQSTSWASPCPPGRARPAARPELTGCLAGEPLCKGFCPLKKGLGFGPKKGLFKQPVFGTKKKNGGQNQNQCFKNSPIWQNNQIGNFLVIKMRSFRNCLTDAGATF